GFVAWVTMRAEDTGPPSFWSRLLPTLGENGVLALDQAPWASAIGSVDVHDMAGMLGEAFDTVTAPLTLVLDDYHVATSEVLDAQLLHVLERRHDIRIIVITRARTTLHSVESA